ncbi:hypothetical protein VTJ04DRAFT_5768 [Mycothermus thermophilus]|uniref:uncharacterized protein n=1 Tax=Humicola insolens TaxID=85995 RepID=UPI003743ACCC
MAHQSPGSEPIAIVGTNCRFAGHVTNPSRLWELLENPTDLAREVPPERFNIHAQAFYHADGEYHGATNSPKAYFLDQDHRVFDAGFFGISPKEAEAIDPQQRMTLEVVYEALESAGYSLRRYAGAKVGVFAGLMTGDYDTLSQRDELSNNKYYATGNARSILANRISYFFDFRGPSMTIDTACSSSLVALHQAILSLRAGECTMACVAGANLILTPEQSIAESKLHMLSPTGHCRMWDAAADGYARGEGIAAILVKTLKQAFADGDHIEAIIRETGVNSDGHTPGITMPNWEAQSRLIQETYRRAGLDSRNPNDRCQYFEAHGTGTPAGDPNEARAIEDAFFKHGKQSSDAILLVGSIKTVVGHTEGAAGLAGLLKIVESMRHDTIPPNLHFENLSPTVQPYYSKLRIPAKALPWPEPPTGQPKRGSVNSFGFGGTNAHAIIEQYVPEIHNRLAKWAPPALQGSLQVRGDPAVLSEEQRTVLPLVLSAPSQTSLAAVIKTYRDYLIRHPEESFAELAYHAYARRTAFRFRLAITSISKSNVIAKLDSLLAAAKDMRSPNLGTRTRTRTGSEEFRILGVFTGQGAQWATMSRGLFRSSRVFADSIRNLDMVLKTCPDPPSWSLEDEILADEDVSRVNQANVSQPLCTAVQIALVDLLRHMGIGFAAVVGHSSGEIAAAYAAGKLSARDAILVAHYRGLGVHMACGRDGKPGGMLAAGLTREEALKLCSMRKYSRRLWVAAVNSPSSVTLSGDVDAVQEAAAELGGQGKFVRVLRVDKAYHSPHMEDVAVKYLDKLMACNIKPMGGNGTHWVSSVYGWGGPPEAELAAWYWKDNMAKPVLFCDAVSTTLKTLGPFDCAIEAGPHPALKGPVKQIIQHRNVPEIPYAGLLDRNLDDREAFASFLGWLWTEFDQATGPDYFHRFVLGSSQPELTDTRVPDAPRYPWDHSQILYRESRITRQYHFKTDPPHELLGVRTRDDNKHQMRWRNILKLERLPWVEHHSFQGKALLPASAYVVMALDAARVAVGSSRSASVVELRDLRFASGIILEPETPGVEVLFDLTIQRDSREMMEALFTLCSTIADGRTDMSRNFSGNLVVTFGEPSTDALPSRRTERPETLPASPDGFYTMMAKTGLAYTGPFKAIQTINRRYNFGTTTLRRRHDDDTTTLAISPATLDACLQTAFLTISSPGDEAIWTSFLPVDITSVRFNLAALEEDGKTNAAQDTLAVDAYLTRAAPASEKGPASFTADIEIFDAQGTMEIQVEGLTVASIGANRPENDRELYLTTTFDLDPDDEVVSADLDELMRAPNHTLIESCERVAAFYLAQRETVDDGPTAWPDETEESIRTFARASPYFPMLERVRQLIQTLPSNIEQEMRITIQQAHQLAALHRHLARIARQIAHKYPRMHVLGLTDPKLGLTEHILAGLGESFTSYRIGTEPEENLDARLPVSRAIRSRIVKEKVALGSHDSDPNWYDLVILTTSVIGRGRREITLDSVRRMTRPGGFLVLLDVSKSTLKDQMSNNHEHADWNGLLDVCGFAHAMTNSHQTSHRYGFDLFIRQAESFDKRALLHPFARDMEEKLTKGLLVIGGENSSTNSLVSGVLDVLTPRCGSIWTASSLDEVDVKNIGRVSAVMLLQDLDKPVLAGTTPKALAALRFLFRPEMTFLWVTRGARYANPDHAASLGFARTIAAETPGLLLQVLDLGSEEGACDRLTEVSTAFAVEAITEGFARLAMHKLLWDDDGDPDLAALWVLESEVYVEQGHRYVARAVPWREANDRVNAGRRTVEKTVNTLEKVVVLEPSKSSRNAGRGAFEIKVKDRVARASSDGKDEVRTMMVEYSTLDAIQIRGRPLHFVVGRDVDSSKAYLALVRRLGSFGETRSIWTVPINPYETNPPAVLACLLRYLVALGIEHAAKGRHIHLVGSDLAFAEALREVMGWTNVPLTVYTTDKEVYQSASSLVFLHPASLRREVRGLYDASGAWVIDMLPAGSKLSEILRETKPRDGRYSKFSDVLASLSLNLTPETFKQAVSCALEKTASLPHGKATNAPLIAVSDLLHLNAHPPHFHILDWKSQRQIQHPIHPLAGSHLLSARKTYILVGLTRDFGQSLSTLLVDQGARHIVLCSRHPPNTQPVWQREMLARGVVVRFEKLDVTRKEQVAALKERLKEVGLPPVGGIVNGAMVLEDRVFAHMSVESLRRVMEPKTVGSANLDEVFGQEQLDFFIMTSSFAAIGGHAGQSNYAAANMYMNGLAAARRRRGLPGSVLNIGVIYGLGFLHREKDDLYQGLEREGYPPISERDLHHMFVEAIVAGRPMVRRADGEGYEEQSVYDITTGLRRFDADNPMLAWQKDPRFSHFTIQHHDNSAGDGKESGDETSEDQHLRNGSGSNIPLCKLLDGATTRDELVAVLLAAVAERVRQLLQLNEGFVTGEHTVSELGGDSLAAVELRSWAWRALGLDLSVMKIMGGATVRALAEELAGGMMALRGRDRKGGGGEQVDRKGVTGEEGPGEAGDGGLKESVSEEMESEMMPGGSTQAQSPASAGSVGMTEASTVSDLSLASASRMGHKIDEGE